MLDKHINIKLSGEDREAIGKLIGETIGKAMAELDDTAVVIGQLTVNIYSNHAVHDGATASMDLKQDRHT